MDAALFLCSPVANYEYFDFMDIRKLVLLYFLLHAPLSAAPVFLVLASYYLHSESILIDFFVISSLVEVSNPDSTCN